MSHKKIFSSTVYGSPSQNNEQCENFMSNMQIMINQLQIAFSTVGPHSGELKML